MHHDVDLTVVESASNSRKFFSYQELVARGIRFSRVHLRRLEMAGAFPMHLTLGAGASTQAANAWLADEILAWEEERINERDAKIQQQFAAADVGSRDPEPPGISDRCKQSRNAPKEERVRTKKALPRNKHGPKNGKAVGVA
jgi:predicted DNA-binding transcriptional regulator AlpA